MDRVVAKPILEKALEIGFTTAGVARIDSLPEVDGFYQQWLDAGFHAEMGYLDRHVEAKRSVQNLLPSAKSIIAVTLNYYQPIPSGDAKIARYALGRDYHKVLTQKLKTLARFLKSEHGGIETYIAVDSSPTYDRMFAHLAGLGWFGKNSMLIDSRRGSWFFIGLLITSLGITPTGPSMGGCGNCRLCIDACPTGAIKQLNGRWCVDSRDCISYQTIEDPSGPSSSTDGWLFGCDVCQEVCPFNQPRESQPLRSSLTTESDFQKREGRTLEQISAMSEGEWDQWTRGRALRRRPLRLLKQNALAAVDHQPTEVSGDHDK